MEYTQEVLDRSTGQLETHSIGDWSIRPNRGWWCALVQTLVPRRLASRVAGGRLMGPGGA